MHRNKCIESAPSCAMVPLRTGKKLYAMRCGAHARHTAFCIFFITGRRQRLRAPHESNTFRIAGSFVYLPGGGYTLYTVTYVREFLLLHRRDFLSGIGGYKIINFGALIKSQIKKLNSAPHAGKGGVKYVKSFYRTIIYNTA